MKSAVRALVALSLGVGTVALISSTARAAIVCNEDGDCWHAQEVYTYPPSVGVVVHPNDWKWEGDKYRWREHEGRGYWRGGAWTQF